MSKKIALTGVRGLAFAPVTENTVLAYKSTAAKVLPHLGSISRTPKEKRQDIYYDGMLYGQHYSYLGDEVEIRLGEMTLEKMAEFGLGTYNPETKLFEGGFAPKPGLYSVRFVGETIDGEPYYFKWLVFELNSIRFDNFVSMGENAKVNEVILKGVLKAPLMPGVPVHAIMQGADDNAAACAAFMANGDTYPKAA